MTVVEPQGRFAVVIVAHRSYATLSLCLSGFRALVHHPADLIFVDNGSGGGLAKWAGAAFPDITVITLAKNELFCGGYNAGIRLAMDEGYDYVLIANADTEVINPAFVERLVEAMHRHPRAAFAGPLVYYRRPGTVQRTCLQFPNALRSALVWLPYRVFPQAITRQPTREQRVDFLNGVCVLCRVRALDEIGLMDETFGAYVEDTDWSWRAGRLGWYSLFVPEPSLVHHEETEGYEHHSFKTFLLKRNTVHWLLKAGRGGSARAYAAAAVALAQWRAWRAADPAQKSALQDFARRLAIVYRRLLAREELGAWYGPPLNNVEAAVPAKAQANANAP
mgnify:CR=1 FL=1